MKLYNESNPDICDDQDKQCNEETSILHVPSNDAMNQPTLPQVCELGLVDQTKSSPTIDVYVKVKKKRVGTPKAPKLKTLQGFSDLKEKIDQNSDKNDKP